MITYLLNLKVFNKVSSTKLNSGQRLYQVQKKDFLPQKISLIPNQIKIFKFEKFDDLLNSNVDLIVLGISSKGIEWVSDQLSRLFKNEIMPNLLMLTKMMKQ